MEHGKIVKDREWLAIEEAIEQRVRASDYELTLRLIVRAINEHVESAKDSYSIDRMNDGIVLTDRRELLQKILNILKYRQPDMFAVILATVVRVNHDGEAPEEN